MAMEMNIRKAVAADVDNLKLLVNGAYRGEGSKQGWTTEADLITGNRITVAALLVMLQNSHIQILLAETSEVVVGCVCLEKQQQHLYLGMLSVKPDLQGKGIGAALMQAAEHYAAAMSFTSIRMTVITVRHLLIAYYNRKGYRDTGERKPFQDGETFGFANEPLQFMVMEKILCEKPQNIPDLPLGL